MDQKGLRWAEQLHAELVARVEYLSEALADVEPLRQELVRLQGQVRGVERLIALHHQLLGKPQPSWVCKSPEANAGKPDGSIVYAGEPNRIAENVPGIPLLAYREPTLDYAGRELLRVVALYRDIAARFFLRTRLRFTKQFLRRSAQ
jgi:hypothetical protein